MGELSSLRFRWTLKHKPASTLSAKASEASPPHAFVFGADGVVGGHPTGEPFQWMEQCNARSVVIGPPEAPFPPLYASRAADWSWRLENRNVLLIELGGGREGGEGGGGEGDGEGGGGGEGGHEAWHEASAGDESDLDHDLDDLMAVMVDGEVYYLPREEAAAAADALEILG